MIATPSIFTLKPATMTTIVFWIALLFSLITFFGILEFLVTGISQAGLGQPVSAKQGYYFAAILATLWTWFYYLTH